MTYLDLLQQKVERTKITNKNNDLHSIVDTERAEPAEHSVQNTYTAEWTELTYSIYSIDSAETDYTESVYSGADPLAEARISIYNNDL